MSAFISITRTLTHTLTCTHKHTHTLTVSRVRTHTHTHTHTHTLQGTHSQYQERLAGFNWTIALTANLITGSANYSIHNKMSLITVLKHLYGIYQLKEATRIHKHLCLVLCTKTTTKC